MQALKRASFILVLMIVSILAIEGIVMWTTINYQAFVIGLIVAWGLSALKG